MHPYAVVRSPQRGKSSNVASLPLARAVDLLAENIQRSMAALYSLQTALINVLARHRGSKPLLGEIERIRQLLRDEWEKVINLVQHFYSYSDDYVSLCELAMTQKHPSDTWTYIKDLVIASQEVLMETRDVRMRHEGLNKELGRQRIKLKSALAGTWSSTDGPRPGARRKSSSIDSYSNRFFEAAHASLNPDGGKALDDSYESLRQISTALGDLFSFWKDHNDQLVAIHKRRRPLPFTREELGKQAISWRNQQAVLLAAISSISASSDAVTVNAPGNPAYTGMKYTQDGFWKSLKTFLRKFRV